MHSAYCVLQSLGRDYLDLTASTFDLCSDLVVADRHHMFNLMTETNPENLHVLTHDILLKFWKDIELLGATVAGFIFTFIVNKPGSVNLPMVASSRVANLPMKSIRISTSHFLGLQSSHFRCFNVSTSENWY